MNSSIKSVSEILNDAQRIVCAKFADSYNFDNINAEEYFDELIENSKFSSPIFSGIIIMEQVKKKFTIVDGLQRLTTLSLLLCALCENYQNTSVKNQEAKDKIFERFLIHNRDPKLDLRGFEQNVYKKILFGEELDESEKNTNLALTYQAFLKKIKKSRISGTEFFKIVSKIQFMFVLIDKSEVSIKELYKTLNDNKDKSQINMVLNFISQKCNSKETMWQEVLLAYKSSGIDDLFDLFIRDFLTIQNDGKSLGKNALYNGFKSYFTKMTEYRNDLEIIDNFCKYALYYLKIVNADFENILIRTQVEVLNQHNGQDAYPYLMEVLDDLENRLINDEVLLDILIMINSFILQRAENSLSGITISFASLSKEINKMLVIKDYVPQIIDENKLSINEVNNLSTFEI